MGSIRSRPSCVVVCGMVLLAVRGGMPSTACICANGRIKLVCSHRCGTNHHHGDVADLVGCATDHYSCCCAETCDEHLGSRQDAADCVGGAAVVHDCCNPSGQRGLTGDGISSRGGCSPVASLVTTLSELGKATPRIESPLAQVPVATKRFYGGPVAAAHYFNEPSTGPPGDLVVTLGRFLI